MFWLPYSLILLHNQISNRKPTSRAHPPHIPQILATSTHRLGKVTGGSALRFKARSNPRSRPRKRRNYHVPGRKRYIVPGYIPGRTAWRSASPARKISVVHFPTNPRIIRRGKSKHEEWWVRGS